MFGKITSIQLSLQRLMKLILILRWHLAFFVASKLRDGTLLQQRLRTTHDNGPLETK